MKICKGHLFLLFLLWSTSLQGSSFRKTGTVGYTFLEIPVTSRQAALGEAAGTVVNDAGILSLFANPGVLGMQNGYQFGVEQSRWIGDISHSAAGAVIPAGLLGHVGIGFNFVDYGSLDHTNADGEQLGQYTAQSAALGLTWSRRLTDKFSWGVRLNAVQEQIHTYSSENLLLDMGVYYETGFQSLRFAGYINNFGVDGKFIRDSFKMPTVLRLGLAYDLWNSPVFLLTLAAELSHPADNPERFHLAVEQRIFDRFYLRTAFRNPVDEDAWSFGGGLVLKKIRADMAVIPFGRFPAVYYFGIQVNR